MAKKGENGLKKWLVLLLLAAFTAGCGWTPWRESEKREQKEVVLSMYGLLPDEQFKTEIEEPVKKKFPYITLNYKSASGIGELATLIEAGQIPDIVLDIDRVTIPVEQLDKLQFDLSGFIEANKLDLSKFDSGLLEHVKAYGKNGEIYALPYSRYLYALYYNKDVFDALGVNYPADGMSWNELLELTKEICLRAEGKNIRGLDPSLGLLSYVMLMDQLGLSLVDPETETSQVTSAEWIKLFELWRSIYSIPGNMPDAANFHDRDAFAKRGEVAMAFGEDLGLLTEGTANVLNIDMASVPVFPEAPDKGPGSRSQVLMITATSPHKEEAFDVISYLVSEEVQLNNARNGKASALNDAKMAENFAANLAIARDKNIAAFFKNKVGSAADISKYEGIAFMETQETFFQIAGGALEIEEAAKQLDDKINAAILMIKQQAEERE